MSLDKPRLIFAVTIRRRRYWTRFWRALLLVALAAGAYLALQEASNRGLVEDLVLNIGQLVAVILGGLMLVRALYALVRLLTVRDETLRFYDQGFVWETRKFKRKYAWHEVVTFREGARGLYLRRWVIFQRGAHVLTMRNGDQLRMTGRFGDLRPLTKAIRRYITYVTSTQMGRTLRNEQSVTLHPKLTLYPSGIEARGVDIHWSDLDIRRKNHTLIIRYKDENGRFVEAAKFSIHEMDNFGGFLDLAIETMRNHQPERFARQRKAS